MPSVHKVDVKQNLRIQPTQGPIRKSAEFVGGSGEVEVFWGEAAGVVGDEGEADLVVADVNVRMVAGVFGDVANLVDEGEGGPEVLEEEGADEFAGLNLPVGDGDEAGLGLGFGKRGHGCSFGGNAADEAASEPNQYKWNAWGGVEVGREIVVTNPLVARLISCRDDLKAAWDLMESMG